MVSKVTMVKRAARVICNGQKGPYAGLGFCSWDACAKANKCTGAGYRHFAKSVVRELDWILGIAPRGRNQ